MTDEKRMLQLEKLLEDAEHSETFYSYLDDEIIAAVQEDDETPVHKYSHFVASYLKASPEEKAIMDDACIAFTGWRASTLLENTLTAYAVTHTLPEIEAEMPAPNVSKEPQPMLSDLIQAASQQRKQQGSAERLQYDMADTLIMFGERNNLVFCSTNPIGMDPLSYNAHTVFTSGTDGKEAVLKRHEARLNQLNRQAEKNDPLPEL